MVHTEQKLLILASSSPRRQELIRLLGLPYEVIVSDVNENVESAWSAAEIVEKLSLRKAQAVLDILKANKRQGIIIGSDTIVVHNGEVLGKPVDEQDARRMLSSLQGNTHYVYSGLACITSESEQIVNHTVSKVTFRAMSDAEIRGYIQTGETGDKAGAYGVQGLGSVFIERIEGDFYSVMGLPMNLLYQMLVQLGVSPFGVR